MEGHEEAWLASSWGYAKYSLCLAKYCLPYFSHLALPMLGTHEWTLRSLRSRESGRTCTSCTYWTNFNKRYWLRIVLSCLIVGKYIVFLLLPLSQSTTLGAPLTLMETPDQQGEAEGPHCSNLPTWRSYICDVSLLLGAPRLKPSQLSLEVFCWIPARKACWGMYRLDWLDLTPCRTMPSSNSGHWDRIFLRCQGITLTWTFEITPGKTLLYLVWQLLLLSLYIPGLFV